MTFKISSFLLVILLLQLNVLIAQDSWYENSASVHHLIRTEAINGKFTTNQTNPATNGLNTNETASKFVKDGQGDAYKVFRFPNPITDLTGLNISLKAFIEIQTADLNTDNNNLQIELRNSTLEENGSIFEEAEFLEGETWETFSFNFDSNNIPAEILDAGGFDIMRIGFALGNNPEETTYYIDAIEGSVPQLDATLYADWIRGSWGVTFPVFGGERLDGEVAGGYDLVSGAQEIVAELPETGHIITNLSYFAHSHYFPISRNANIDLATEIHPSMVPTAPNDEIIFDVLDVLQNAGKKIILYIHVGFFEDAAPEVQAIWIDYYNTNFDGDEYAAYEYVLEGFIKEVKDYADGYWLDGAHALDDIDRLDDFHAMIRSTDPDAAISIQGDTEYFRDDDGNLLFVDSDGVDDIDPTDYRIVRFRPQQNLGNFTGGHVTPLGQGAPPNSWGYEEYTIPDMVTEPLIDFDGRPIVKHGWFPMRDRWHVPTRPLIFETEQAYRFTKIITNANAGVTFASTTTSAGNRKGFMMDDELAIFKIINERLAMNPLPDCEPYVRPEGAHLVGEDPITNVENEFGLVDISVFPNPAQEEVFVNLNLQSQQRVDIVVSNYLGQDQKRFSVDADTNQLIQLNTSDFLSGIYFIQIAIEGQNIFTEKVLITKHQ